MNRAILFLLALLLGGVGHAKAALIHDYELNNSYADILGGPSLVPNGGTLEASGYTLAANQGLSLSNAIDPNNYSIQMGVSLSELALQRS